MLKTVFFFCIFIFHCLRPDFLLPHFQLNKYVFITTMCHLLIPNRSSTEFNKSFQITPVFTHLRPLFPVFSIATLLDSLLLPHGQLSNLHTLSLFFSSQHLCEVNITIPIPQMMNLRLRALTTLSPNHRSFY